MPKVKAKKAIKKLKDIYVIKHFDHYTNEKKVDAKYMHYANGVLTAYHGHFMVQLDVNLPANYENTRINKNGRIVKDAPSFPIENANKIYRVPESAIDVIATMQDEELHKLYDAVSALRDIGKTVGTAWPAQLELKFTPESIILHTEFVNYPHGGSVMNAGNAVWPVSVKQIEHKHGTHNTIERYLNLFYLYLTIRALLEHGATTITFEATSDRLLIKSDVGRAIIALIRVRK